MQALPTHRGSDRHRALRLKYSTLAARLNTAARASSSDGRLRRPPAERSLLAGGYFGVGPVSEVLKFLSGLSASALDDLQPFSSEQVPERCFCPRRAP